MALVKTHVTCDHSLRYSEDIIEKLQEIKNHSLNEAKKIDSHKTRNTIFDDCVNDIIINYLYHRIVFLVVEGVLKTMSNPEIDLDEDDIKTLIELFEQNQNGSLGNLDVLQKLQGCKLQECWRNMIFRGYWTLTDVIGSLLSLDGKVSIGLVELALDDRDNL